MVDQRVHVLDHQLQARIDVVREAFGAQDARQHALAVEDILAQRHGALLQGADAVQHGLVDRIFGVDVLRERRNLLGDQLHEVGVEVDAHLQERNEEVITRRIVAVVHLQALLRLAESPEFGTAHRNQHTLVRNDERHGFDDERVARRHEEVGVGDDGILVFGVFRSRFDLLDLLFGLKADLHEILDGLLLLDRGQKHVDPQNVVVTQLVEELRVGIADNLVVLLEVNRNHKTLSFLKFIIPFGREADSRPLSSSAGIGPRRHLDAGVPELLQRFMLLIVENIVDILR